MTENQPAGQEHPLIHTKAISLELDWLQARIELSLAALRRINRGPESGAGDQSPAPELPPESWYAKFVEEHQLEPDERLILILALAPEIDPGLLDHLLAKGDSRLGGVTGVRHRGFLPTIQTALFLLAAGDISRNLEARKIFDPAGRLLSRNIIIPGGAAPGEPYTSMGLSVRPGVSSYLCTGRQRPMVVEDFPAHRLKSQLTWDELVLPPHLFTELDIIRDWLKHCRELRAKFRYSRPGFKALFYGPSGTGKSLTAALLGQDMGLPVYHLDLGRTITKDLGATERNLDALLNLAERQNGILFFDETDIMLGKSGDNRRSSDSYITQGITSLLSRLEGYDGLVILADSVEDNLNRVMNFRFSTRLYFPQPDAMGRVRLWRNILGDLFRLPEDFGLTELAEYNLSGGEIVNIVQFLTLGAIKKNDFHLTREALVKAVERQIVDSAHGVTG